MDFTVPANEKTTAGMIAHPKNAEMWQLKWSLTG